MAGAGLVDAGLGTGGFDVGGFVEGKGGVSAGAAVDVGGESALAINEPPQNAQVHSRKREDRDRAIDDRFIEIIAGLSLGWREIDNRVGPRAVLIPRVEG